MTDLDDSSSERMRERDAPAVANTPSIWQLLRALSNLRRKLTARRAAARKGHHLRLYRMNEYMLQDIGLARTEDEDSALRPFHPLILPLQRRDD
jgi:uncharacterized protein YjiS (DUF1127 family)